jgi:hypothetical protein
MFACFEINFSFTEEKNYVFMYDVDVIYMLIMYRRQRMEEKQQRVDQYNIV